MGSSFSSGPKPDAGFGPDEKPPEANCFRGFLRTFAQQDGHTYGLVILGSNSQNIFREAAELFDWAFTSPELHPAPVEAEPEKQERGGFWHKLFG